MLEGSVRKVDKRVRITAQLIDATNDGHLWAERFNRDLTDIFAVQDDVTGQIVGALSLNLTQGDRRRLMAEQTDNMEAFDCFLRGRELWWRHAKELNAQARELLLRAAELDPQFAPAFAWLGAAHINDYVSQWTDQPLGSLDLRIRRPPGQRRSIRNTPRLLGSDLLQSLDAALRRRDPRGGNCDRHQPQ